MTVDLSSGIDRHCIGWLIQYVELRVTIVGTLDVTFFPYRSHRICNCIRLHQDCIHIYSVQPYSYTAFSLDTLMLYETINQCITSVG